MDALAGYGSDSDNSDQVTPSPSNRDQSHSMSSIISQYLGEDSDVDDTVTISPKNIKVKENSCRWERAIEDPSSTQKRQKRWDNPPIDNQNVIPIAPPTLLFCDTIHNQNDPYKSLILFRKDYTSTLRQKLSRQLQEQTQEEGVQSMELAKTLQQLNDQFQLTNTNVDGDAKMNSTPTATTTTSPFVAHLKSKRDLGNPHLLKTIVDHFHIQPLQSHIGNKFKSFEYVERLISAEERARDSSSSRIV